MITYNKLLSWKSYKSNLKCFTLYILSDVTVFRTGMLPESPSGLILFGGDVTVHALHINQLSFPTPFYYALVSISVFMALSSVFHPMNSPDNS